MRPDRRTPALLRDESGHRLNYTASMKAPFVLFAAGPSPGTGPDPDRAGSQGPGCGRCVSARELLRDPARYAGQSILIKGFWRTGFESSSLVTSRRHISSRVWVTCDCAVIESQDGQATKRSGGTLNDESRRSALDHGISLRFKGLCFVESRLRSPPSRSTPMLVGGYGHLDWWHSQITIRRLDEHEVVTY